MAVAHPGAPAVFVARTVNVVWTLDELPIVAPLLAQSVGAQSVAPQIVPPEHTQLEPQINAECTCVVPQTIGV